MRQAIAIAERAAWAALGATVLLALAAYAAGPSPARSEAASPEVAAYADLVVELVRRIDAAGGEEAIAGLLARIEAGDDDAARWADRAIAAGHEADALRAAMERNGDAAAYWAVRAGVAEAGLRAARRGDLDGDGVADGTDLGIVLLAIAGDLPPEPEHPWWWPQLFDRGRAGGEP